MPVVCAVGVAVGNHGADAARVEAALVEAVRACQAAGVTDPAVIQAAILDARARVVGDA